MTSCYDVIWGHLAAKQKFPAKKKKSFWGSGPSDPHLRSGRKFFSCPSLVEPKKVFRPFDFVGGASDAACRLRPHAAFGLLVDTPVLIIQWRGKR